MIVTTRKRRGMSKIILLLAAVAGGLLLGGCGGDKSKAFQPQPVEVGVTVVTSEDLPVYVELPGRVSSPRVAQVRARVTGVLKKRLFVEGSEVKEGDVLFQIDPDPLQAVYDSAKAALDKAEATLAQDELTASRYQELVKIGAVSKQDCDAATATLAEQRAEAQAQKAALKSAELNLSYTKVVAPISGRIGKALVTEGALVSSGELTELAVIQQLDRVYFDFTQSNADVLKLRRSLASGKLSNAGSADSPVSLILDDGTTYECTGKLLFSDISVDESTGMVSLRAEFPNPDKLLLPGSFARIRITQATDKNSVTVPQRAISRNTDGSARVLIVGEGNKVESRTITTGDAMGDKWVVTSGLKAGEIVIVEGLQKVKSGQTVTTVPFVVASASGAAKSATTSKEN
jgi:membrane fusion protein, multidrug efflux system